MRFEQARASCVTPKRSRTAVEDARQAARVGAEGRRARENRAHAIHNEPDRPTFIAPQLNALADQLDDKARLLEEAAQQQRDAVNEQCRRDPGRRDRAGENWADYALEQADAMQLDYGRSIRGAARRRHPPLADPRLRLLMDPNDATAAVVPAGTGTASPDDVSGAARDDDTDLMDPNDSAAADVDPTVPAVDDAVPACPNTTTMSPSMPCRTTPTQTPTATATPTPEPADTYGDSYADPACTTTLPPCPTYPHTSLRSMPEEER